MGAGRGPSPGGAAAPCRKCTKVTASATLSPGISGGDIEQQPRMPGKLTGCTPKGKTGGSGTINGRSRSRTSKLHQPVSGRSEVHRHREDRVEEHEASSYSLTLQPVRVPQGHDRRPSRARCRRLFKGPQGSRGDQGNAKVGPELPHRAGQEPHLRLAEGVQIRLTRSAGFSEECLVRLRTGLYPVRIPPSGRRTDERPESAEGRFPRLVPWYSLGVHQALRALGFASGTPAPPIALVIPLAPQCIRRRRLGGPVRRRATVAAGRRHRGSEA